MINFLKSHKLKKMKKIISLLSTVITIVVLTIALSLSSCQKESLSQIPDNIPDQAALISSAKSGAPLKVDLVHIDMDIKVMSSNVYNVTAPYTQVIAPDGHAVTLNEFHMVSGWADVKCINSGTHVVVHLQGLIPNGVYTLWAMRFNSANPGPPDGVGALGAPDGSGNVLKVNSEGTADLSVIMPGGNLSIFGSLPNCWSSTYKVMVAGAYHLDRQTHGSSPGGSGGFSTYVLQFGFPVMGARL